MFLNTIIDTDKTISPGITFTSKRLLKFAIILFGVSLNINVVFNVGKLSIYVMIFTLLTCFGLCGGSVIAAITPVIKAEDTHIAYAMRATFLFDMFMIIAFPIMGRAMGLCDMAYGLWTGTAVR